MKTEIKNALKGVLNKAGLRISRTKYENVVFNIGDFRYSNVMPYATYSPWLSDAAFMETFNNIKDNTLVDIFRCYELWKLSEEAITLNREGAFLEVGVWRGGTAGIIGKKIALMKSNNKLYLADTFAGVVKSSDADKYYNNTEHSDTSEDIVNALLTKQLGLVNYKILKGIFPEDTAHDVNEDVFVFCHVDVDVYQGAKDIVEWVFPKLIVGGIIVFDDYGFQSCVGVAKYVNEQMGLADRVIIHNLNGHAIMIKVN